MAENDIIIVDEEFVEEARRALTDATGAEETLDGLIAILDKITTDDLQSGNVAGNFNTYVSAVKDMKGKLHGYIEEEKAMIDKMVAEIKAADTYNYGG